jgi:hypothetical protein
VQGNHPVGCKDLWMEKPTLMNDLLSKLSECIEFGKINMDAPYPPQLEGNGYKVVDLGTDVGSEKFIAALKEYPGASAGPSALLTTTMANMEMITPDIKAAIPGATIAIGGAPVNDEFCRKIGADFYSLDPQGVVEFMNIKLAS